MNVEIIREGKPAFSQYGDLVSVYKKRLSPFTTVHDTRLKTISADVIGKPFQFLIALDERGKQFSSVEISNLINEKRSDNRVKNLAFVIGGPYGLQEDVLAAADLKLALSKSVLTSDLAWLVMWEQLYRAYSIINGGSYHHQ
ncbi:MAG: 23S rRNA (pseudouridine(1915)-N(3))-methyltransferase RlmH [Oligoflexales bacterium]